MGAKPTYRELEQKIRSLEKAVEEARNMPADSGSGMGESAGRAGRKKDENSPEKSAELYRLLAENIHDIIWVADLDFNLSYISPSVERVVGYTPEEIKKSAHKGLLTPESFTRLMELHAGEISRSGADPHKSHTIELEVICKDGTKIWSETAIRTLCDGMGNPVSLLGVGRDITDRKRAEEERTLYEKALMRSQKMEAIGTLAGGIAHDFNNILSPIVGFTELTIEELPKDGKAHRNLSEVLKSAQRAKDLIHQILTFSRQAGTRSRPVQVHLVVKEVLKLVRSSIPSTIKIVQQIDVRSGQVMADPTQIYQVIMNLCTNAYQAMSDDGGTLTVILEPMYADAGFIKLHPNIREGAYVKLSVRDSGCGMDDDTLRRIFDPFFTTKGMIVGGAGLGLATVHGIVTSLNGTILVSSEPGTGSSFDVYLPAHEETARQAEQREVEVCRGHGECVLMVDDEEIILEMGKSMLISLGYRAVTVSSSVHALDIFKLNPYDFDCIITDRTMPFMTGEELVREMLKIRPDLPVILTSGYSENTGPVGTDRPGVGEFLDKPYTMAKLAQALARILRPQS